MEEKLKKYVYTPEAVDTIPFTDGRLPEASEKGKSNVEGSDSQKNVG